MNLPRLFFFSDSFFGGGFGGLTVGVYTGSGVARFGSWISGKEGIFDIFAFLSWKPQEENDLFKIKTTNESKCRNTCYDITIKQTIIHIIKFSLVDFPQVLHLNQQKLQRTVMGSVQDIWLAVMFTKFFAFKTDFKIALKNTLHRFKINTTITVTDIREWVISKSVYKLGLQYNHLQISLVILSEFKRIN